MTILNFNSIIQGWPDVWRLCGKSRSEQCKNIFKVPIIFVYITIWMVRNKVKCNACHLHVSSSISYIMTYVSTVGNIFTSSHLGIQDFVLLKIFKVNIRNPKAHNIIEVIW